ncbi:MAG: class I SAM-dependent methyltransferase [Bacteroidota bacterium]
MIPQQLFDVYLRTVLSVRRGGVHEALMGDACQRDLTVQEKKAIGKILAMRNGLSLRKDRIAIRDYGAGSGFHAFSEAGQNSPGRIVSEIHATSAVPRHWGIFLFRLVRALNPRTVLELGTNLGVSASYIRAALDLNEGGGALVTIEGDPTLASIAEGSIAQVSSGSVKVIVGRFQDTLPKVLKDLGSVDLVFIDGHHEHAAMIRYYESAKGYLSKDSCVVFDDLYLWNRSLRSAWHKILAGCPQSEAYDFAKLGILFPNTN